MKNSYLKKINKLKKLLKDAADNCFPSFLVERMFQEGIKKFCNFEDSLIQNEFLSSEEVDHWVNEYIFRMKESSVYYTKYPIKKEKIFSNEERFISINQNLLYPPNYNLTKEYKAYQVLHEYGNSFATAIAMLETNFPFTEIDSPDIIQKSMRFTREKGQILKLNTKHKFYIRYILVVLKDSKNQIIAVCDGSLLINSKHILFYCAHIFVDKSLRKKGIARKVEAAALSVADNYIQEACNFIKEKRSQSLHAVIAESEFGSFSPLEVKDSFTRLFFHSKTGKKLIHPIAYLQPDTLCNFEKFDPNVWESVPMFLLLRLIGREDEKTISRELVMEYAELILNSFIFPKIQKGVECDIRFLHRNTPKLENLSLVTLPSKPSNIISFIAEVGDARDVYTTLYQEKTFVKKWLKTHKKENDLNIKQAIELLSN